jgi:hypothetical protein
MRRVCDRRAQTSGQSLIQTLFIQVIVQDFTAITPNKFPPSVLMSMITNPKWLELGEMIFYVFFFKFRSEPGQFTARILASVCAIEPILFSRHD